MQFFRFLTPSAALIISCLIANTSLWAVEPAEAGPGYVDEAPNPQDDTLLLTLKQIVELERQLTAHTSCCSNEIPGALINSSLQKINSNLQRLSKEAISTHEQDKAAWGCPTGLDRDADYWGRPCMACANDCHPTQVSCEGSCQYCEWPASICVNSPALCCFVLPAVLVSNLANLADFVTGPCRPWLYEWPRKEVYELDKLHVELDQIKLVLQHEISRRPTLQKEWDAYKKEYIK